MQSKGFSRVFSQHHSSNINSLALSFLYSPTLTSMHDYWKKHSFDYTDQTFVSQVMSVLFNILPRFVIGFIQRSSVQLTSVAQLCPTLCDPMNRSTPGLPVHHQLLEFTQTMCIESVMPSSHLILCHPLLLLPPIPPSIRVVSNESTLHMR